MDGGAPRRPAAHLRAQHLHVSQQRDLRRAAQRVHRLGAVRRPGRPQRQAPSVRIAERRPRRGVADRSAAPPRRPASRTHLHVPPEPSRPAAAATATAAAAVAAAAAGPRDWRRRAARQLSQRRRVLPARLAVGARWHAGGDRRLRTAHRLRRWLLLRRVNIEFYLTLPNLT